MVLFILGRQSKRAQIVSPKTGLGLTPKWSSEAAPKDDPFFLEGGGGLGITKVPSDLCRLLQEPFPRASLHSRNSN